MKTRLNLATAPLENNRPFVLGSLLAGLALVSLLVVLVASTARGWRENRELREEFARKEGELRKFRATRRELEDFFRQPDTRKVLERAEFLNSLIDQRSFPWTRVFMDLERLLPQSVRVVSIAPRMEAGRVQVQFVVGAGSDEAKLQFLRAMQHSGAFSNIQVVSEMRPIRAEQGDRLLVELLAWYAPEPETERKVAGQ